MGRFATAVMATLTLVFLVAPPLAAADPDIQPAGTLPIPAGPAPAWIVADMDSGQVLAAKDTIVPMDNNVKSLLR